MNTTNETHPASPIVLDHNLKFLEQTVLATIFICALIANTLVLMVMLRRRHRRTTRMAFFILSLTIADLFVAFFSVLPMLIWKTTIIFFGGDLLCRLVSFFAVTSTYVSVYTLVVMTIDRYQAIVHPLSVYTWTTRTGLCHIFTVWSASVLLASPQLFIFRLDMSPFYGQKTCVARFLNDDTRWELTYIFWNITVQFILPTCVLIYCYTSVYLIVNRNYCAYRLSDNLKTTSMANLPSISLKPAHHHSPHHHHHHHHPLSASTSTIDRQSKTLFGRHIHLPYPQMEASTMTSVTYFHKPASVMYPVVFRLRRASADSTKTSPGGQVQNPPMQQRYGASHFLSRARLKTIKLTFIVVLAYILCSTPFYTGLIIMTFNGKFLPQKTMNWLLTIFNLLFNLNSCSNPIICLTLSSTFFRRKKPSKPLNVSVRKSQTNNEMKLIHKQKRPSATRNLFLL